MSAANDCTLDALVLNPCPFCGERPKDIEWDDDEGTKWCAAIRCSKTVCLASGPMTGWYSVKREALEWAVRMWNHRIENAVTKTP